MHESKAKYLDGKFCDGDGRIQETSLAKSNDTRWGSHLVTITRFISMFDDIIDVLDNIIEDGTNSK